MTDLTCIRQLTKRWAARDAHYLWRKPGVDAAGAAAVRAWRSVEAGHLGNSEEATRALRLAAAWVPPVRQA